MTEIASLSIRNKRVIGILQSECVSVVGTDNLYASNFLFKSLNITFTALVSEKYR